MLDLCFWDNCIRKTNRKTAFHGIVESDLLDIVKKFSGLNIADLTTQAPDKFLCNFLVNNAVDKPDLVGDILVKNHPANRSKQYRLLFKL